MPNHGRRAMTSCVMILAQYRRIQVRTKISDGNCGEHFDSRVYILTPESQCSDGKQNMHYTPSCGNEPRKGNYEYKYVAELFSAESD